MNAILKTAAAVSIIGLMGCATTYQPHGFSGGFSGHQISENTFAVSFNGNGYTGSGKAHDFALLRSAEVMEENGFKYFILASSSNTTSTSSYTSPVSVNTTGNVYGTTNAQVYGNRINTQSNYNYNSRSTISGGITYVTRRPSSNNTVVGFYERPRNVNGIVYNVSIVLKSLRVKHQIGMKYEIWQHAGNEDEVD